MPQKPLELADGIGNGALLGPGKIELDTGAASDEDGTDETPELAAEQKLLYHDQYCLSAAGLQVS